MKVFCRLLSCLLMAALLLGTLALPASAAGLPFTDVPDGAWYKNAVTYAYENGLFNGTGATTFSPNAPMTRAMFVQVLSNKTSNFEKPTWTGKSSFSDVNKNQWYALAVEWAYRAELISGVGDGKFAPEKNVTREQMALIMYNYAKKTGNDTSFDSSILSQFPDASSVSSWAKEAMQWAVTHKVVNGSDGKLKPGSAAKRCEVAQVAVNADPILENTEVEADPDFDPTFVDPTPDDLPEGALTYQEFVDMFPNMKIKAEHSIAMYVDGASYDRTKMEAILATGISTLRLYAITHISSLMGYYTGTTDANWVILGYSFDNTGNGNDLWLHYYPNDPKNGQHAFYMGDLRPYMR